MEVPTWQLEGAMVLLGFCVLHELCVLCISYYFSLLKKSPSYVDGNIFVHFSPMSLMRGIYDVKI